MLGVAVNTIAVIIGGLVGFFIKKGIPVRISDSVMKILGAAVLCIGIKGVFEGENTLIMVLALVLGTVLGTIIDIDKWINKLAEKAERTFSKNGDGKFAQGFLSATLLFCVGSMAVVGSLNAGISGDNQTLYAKSLLDMISAVMFASSLGIGVTLSAAVVFIYQGAIVLAAGFLAPILSSSAVAEMNCAGSVLIMLIGFNLMGVGKFKVANGLPAILFAPILVYIFALF